MRFEDRFAENFDDANGIHYIKRFFMGCLKEEWPQINEKTKIQQVDSDIVDVLMQDDNRKVMPPAIETIITKRVEAPVFNPNTWSIFQQWKMKKIITTKEEVITNTAASNPACIRKTLMLKTFGIYNHSIGQNFRCSCAYWPMTDTLYVRP